jgi:hypothetical protein
MAGATAIGYIINFVSNNGYNRPALLFAWIAVLLSLVFYQRHRKVNARSLAEREKQREEKEFAEWSQSQKS